MSYCLENYLTVIAPYLSNQLIGAAALSRVRQVAQTLQPTWGALLACNLGSDSSSVKLAVDLLDPATDLQVGTQLLPGWQRIGQLCLDCANPTSASEEAANIWLEFDLDKELSEIPIPSLFLSLPEGHLQRLSGDPTTFCCWLTEKVIEPLFGHTIPVKLQQNLRLCLEALPVETQVLDLGVMLPRQPDTIKINVSGISPLELSQYLTQIGWSGQVTQLEAIAVNLHSLVDRIVLKFDIGVTIAPTIRFECFLDRHLDKSSQWHPLLNYLVENQLCTREKCQALLTWPGLCCEQSSPVPWPQNLAVVSNFLGTRASSVLVRELNHIELTFQPGNNLEAKGYLWFGPDWKSD